MVEFLLVILSLKNLLPRSLANGCVLCCWALLACLDILFQWQSLWHIAVAIAIAITITIDVDVAVMQDCHSQIARLLPDCQIARLPDCQIARSYVQSLTMVCSPFKWSNYVLKNRVSSKLFNIWTRNKNNSPSDDILEWQIVPQCFVVLFEISIWKAVFVMVCSPVKLSSSASLKNRVVIHGNFSNFVKNSKRRVSLGFSFHFPGIFYNFVMYLPQIDILKCHIVLNPPKSGNRTQLCA